MIIKKLMYVDLKYQAFIHFFGGAISKAVATFLTYVKLNNKLINSLLYEKYINK